MNIDSAKKILFSSYQILEGNKIIQLSKVKAPSFGMMYNGTQIVGPVHKELVVEQAPIVEKFFIRYREVWDQLKHESWTEDEAKALIAYDNECWKQYVE